MDPSAELRSKCFMRSIELLAKRVGYDPGALIRWLEGRGSPPQTVLQRLRVETADTSPQYYEVVDDPMESASGKALTNKVDEVISRLDNMLSWYTPVGVRRRSKQRISVTPDGYRQFESETWCLINKFGEAVSPWMTKTSLRTYLAHLQLNPAFSAAARGEAERP